MISTTSEWSSDLFKLGIDSGEVQDYLYFLDTSDLNRIVASDSSTPCKVESRQALLA